jgi:hypothetical protein
LIGRPVTWRIDSAAPPRPSPSARVRIRPVSGRRSWNALGRAHGVLAGQAVRHKNGFGRAGDAGDFRRFAHHRLVQRGAAGGVEDQDVVAAQLGGAQRALGDVDGALAGDDRQALDVDLLGQHGQLFHGGRAAGVERGDQHLFALGFGQAQGKLAGRGGLARALQAGHQDHRRRVESQVQPGRDFAAQHVDQAVIDDLDHLVGRLDRTDDRFAAGQFLGLADEVLDDRQGDVGLEQGDADFAQGFVDVLFGQHAATAETLEDAGKSLCKAVEHAKLALNQDPNAISPHGRSRRWGSSPSSSGWILR